MGAIYHPSVRAHYFEKGNGHHQPKNSRQPCPPRNRPPRVQPHRPRATWRAQRVLKAATATRCEPNALIAHVPIGAASQEIPRAACNTAPKHHTRDIARSTLALRPPLAPAHGLCECATSARMMLPRCGTPCPRARAHLRDVGARFRTPLAPPARRPDSRARAHPHAAGESVRVPPMCTRPRSLSLYLSLRDAKPLNGSAQREQHRDHAPALSKGQDRTVDHTTSGRTCSVLPPVAACNPHARRGGSRLDEALVGVGAEIEPVEVDGHRRVGGRGGGGAPLSLRGQGPGEEERLGTAAGRSSTTAGGRSRPASPGTGRTSGVGLVRKFGPNWPRKA